MNKYYKVTAEKIYETATIARFEQQFKNILEAKEQGEVLRQEGWTNVSINSLMFPEYTMEMLERLIHASVTTGFDAVNESCDLVVSRAIKKLVH